MLRFFTSNGCFESTSTNNNRVNGKEYNECTRCFEWSDGRMGCPFGSVPRVQKSLKNGEYIWAEDFISEAKEMGADETMVKFRFKELAKAYREMKRKKKVDDERALMFYVEIIHAFNDEYRREFHSKKIPVADAKLFVDIVIELEKIGEGRLPVSLLAEFYREAGMFGKCFSYSSYIPRTEDEREIMNEILMRAHCEDASLFVIENIDFYSTRRRAVKRFKCPIGR